MYNKFTANIILKGEKLKVYSLRSGTRQRCPLSPLLFNIVLEVLSHGNQRIKRNKRNPYWKRRSKTLTVSDDMILYIENAKDSTRKLPELINEYSNVTGYKTNTQKSLAYLYSDNGETEREIKETIPFTLQLKE